MKSLRNMVGRAGRMRLTNSRVLLLLMLTLAVPAFAQGVGGSPWENAVNVLRNSFTGPIATGLSLVAIVVGGLTFAYGEGHSKKGLAGIIFGVGMAIGAVNFMAWMFPGA
jgi:type IV secretion system protein TrbC